MVTPKVDAHLRAVNTGSSEPISFHTPSPNTPPDEGAVPTDLFGEPQDKGRPRPGGAGRTEDGVGAEAKSKSRTRVPPLIRTIHEAALLQEVDPIKFDRLLIAQERLATREARVAFDGAFAAMQAELPVIVERGVLPDVNGQPGATYALWEDINEAIKPILSRFGFGLKFKVSQDHNTIVITAILSHASGHAEETTMRLPVDLGGGKNGIQAIGSSTSYGKRYTASALLNITSRGEDDDGRAALGTARITAEQAAELRELIASVKGDERRLTNYLGVPSLEELPPSKLEQAFLAIQAKGGRP